jgi:hypothetical protein
VSLLAAVALDTSAYPAALSMRVVGRERGAGRQSPTGGEEGCMGITERWYWDDALQVRRLLSVGEGRADGVSGRARRVRGEDGCMGIVDSIGTHYRYADNVAAFPR